MWKGNTIAWQINTNGSVKGSGGAPDGDEWFAAALVFAAKRWGNTSGKFDYATEAQKTLDLVRTTDFSSTQSLVRYYTGTDSNGTDASYMLWSAAIPTGTYRYYDGALYTIALLHVSGAFHLWY